MTDAAVDVTVVVPVWNPGPYIEPLIDSLLAQTHPAERLELMFVDDGATDETPARLDRLAEAHPHVRVIHQENSGWPGKPRNVGTDAARGTYVFYVDQDDHLLPRSIERMLEVGMPNRADVIIGKVTSDFRGVPHGVFRETRERCTVRDAPLIDSLTPHKMFRRDFLAEHGIRYPEGKRRLEDQLFMVKSYFNADVVSIVGDYPCYFYKQRPDQKNAGSAAIDPKVYYTNLREILDVVVAHTEPGEFRDLQLRRFYRVEMLGRLSEPAVLRYDDDYRLEILDEVRGIVRDYFEPAVATGLLPVPRARAAAVESGDVDSLLATARAATPVKAWASLDHVAGAGGTWTLSLRAELRDGEDQPVRLVPDGSAWRLTTTGEDPLDVATAKADVDAAFADVVLRERDTAVEWFVPHTLTAQVQPADGGSTVVFAGSATLDPRCLHGGSTLPRGSWDVSVRIHAFGLVKRVRVGAVRADGPQWQDLPPVVLASGAVVLPYFTDPAGNFSLDVGERRKPLPKELDRLPAVATSSQDGSVALTLPVEAPDGLDGAGWTVVLGSGQRELERRLVRLERTDRGQVRLSFAGAAPKARSGWLGLVTDPKAPVGVLGTWRSGRGGIRVTVDAAARSRGSDARRGTGGAEQRLRQVARRARRLARG